MPNPDAPRRPTNSPKWCYQIEPTALAVIRLYGTTEWTAALRSYLASVTVLREQYEQTRERERIALTLAPDTTISLSPGGQNDLVRLIVAEFCPRWTPGGRYVYVGDSAAKWAYFDEALAADLRIAVEAHGKMPDVIVYQSDKRWLVLIEAVTSHGPINRQRRHELAELFAGASGGLVYVTAFRSRRDMVRYLPHISWQTEVWIADEPSHLIHFDGERYLGPLEEPSAG